MGLTRKERATRRKWSTRAWWIATHVFDYIVLVSCGAISLDTLSPMEFFVTVFLALLNASCYTTVQCSSPGYLALKTRKEDDVASVESFQDDDGDEVEEEEMDEEAQLAGSLAFEFVHIESEGEEMVLVNTNKKPTTTRMCDKCHIRQPLRTKHCEDCERCVRQYDHHCDCAGTCVGENNRRLFVLYLFLQFCEASWCLGLAASAFSLQSSIDEWFQSNALFILVWLSVFFTMLFAGALFLYQAYLISTNQTTWEHGRRSSITYLKDLPDNHSPFDRGLLQNWWVFITKGNMNKWIYTNTCNQEESVYVSPKIRTASV